MDNYQLPSTKLIQDIQSWTLNTPTPVINPEWYKQDLRNIEKRNFKPTPVDPNVSPEVFKKRFIEKNGDGVSSDGRKYSTIPAPEIVVRIIRKLWDGTTTDGKKYSDFLPRPASPNDSLDYRLKQLEELYKIPKSEFYTDWAIRWQTKQEEKFTTQVTNRQNESELMKTLKAPYRSVYSTFETGSTGLEWAVADALDLFGADKVAEKVRRWAIQDRSKLETLNQDNKWLIWGIQEWSPSSIIGSLVSAIPNLLLYANPVGATAWIISTGGGLSLEWEAQWQWGFGDKAIAYSAGTISGLLDKISGAKFIDGLLSKGIKKQVAQNFVQKTSNFLKSLKPSDFEAGTEIIQQKIENLWRELMGTEYDKWWKQYIEAGVLGKTLGKVADVWFSQSPIEIVQTQPKSVNKNLDVIQTIKTGLTGNKVLKQAKSRWFDPELDIATYEDLKPTITNDGRVNTDVAQENLQNFIEPYQEQLDNAIAQEWEFVPAQEFRKEILKEMESEKSDIVDYLKWVKLANTSVDTAIQNFWDSNGNIPLEAVNNIKKTLQHKSKKDYLNPDDTAHKAIARAAKNIVENYTKSADVKALNNDLARWYTTREYLQILGSGTKTVKGGRLGKYAARLAGVIIGSKLWPIAGMVGGEVAAKLQSKMMQWALKGTKQAMPEMKSFGNIKKKQQLLLPPPSWKQTSASVVDVKPIAGYAPWILQKYEKARTNRQTSSSSTEDKTTQSQPVQVSGWTRKRVIAIPKKESSWKKVNNSIIQKLKEKKNNIVEGLKKKKETPNVEGKTADIIEKARIVWEKEKNNVSMMIQDHAEKIKDKWDELSKKDVRWGEMTTSYKEQRVLESVYKDIYWEDITEMNIKNYLDTKQSKKLESITKPKSSLPMSQKSEVLYSKPDLESEARKYKSAEEFISKNTYYRGEGGNDVAQWKALIAEWRHYAFNDEVYPKRFGEVKSYVAKPWAKIFDFWEMTFPEFSEKMWLKKRMYMSPSEISSILKEKWYDIIRYNWTYKSTWKPFTHIVELNRDVLIPQTKQQLTEIYNKANKSSLPMAAKSEVKYSEAVGKELEPLKEFLTKQKNYDDKFAELSVKANEIAKEYPWVMWTISEEWREIPANKKILEDLAYYKKLSQSFNELESSKKFIKQMWKMSIMERKALRNSIK